MKGIVLAGGSGTRLFPVTRGISKQLIPVYDKPMVYDHISVLMLAGIREIIIISTPTFIIGEQFIGDDSVCLVLGDNIFYGQGFTGMLKDALATTSATGCATLFAYAVQDPQRFGVVEFDEQGKALSIEEKPKQPRSNYAVTGLYFYPNDVIGVAKTIKPSARGELEITSVNQHYLSQNRVRVQTLGRGFAWLDTGTPASMLHASNFIQTVETCQGVQVAALEEIAYRKHWIDDEQLRALASPLAKNDYGKYLLNLIGKI